MPMPIQVRETAAEQLMRALFESKTLWSFLGKKPRLNPEACEFIFEHVRINGDTEVKELTPIFRATRDGWSAGDFHRLCDNRGPTLCLLQTDQDYMSAGFSSIAWASSEYYTDVEDASACVFALTDKIQVFKTKNPESAVVHDTWTGPRWYNALCLDMDGQDGLSYTKGHERDYGEYEVVRLPDGKNPLTGSTHEYEFTCVELEVFALQ